MDRKLLILLAVTMVGQHFAARAAEHTVESLRQTYEGGIDGIRDDHKRNMERLLETYGTALDNAIEALRKEGDPDPVLLAVAERRRFESDGRVPEKSKSSRLPSSVRKLQSGYHCATGDAAIEMEKKCAALTGRYVAALERLMRHYTNEDKLDLAKNAKTEKERTERILAEIESKLQKLRKTSPRVTSSAPRLGQNLSINLGGGVQMELVWIQALEMWVGKYEVTNGQYRRMAHAHYSRKYGEHSLNGNRQPVVYITFDDARKYASWLNRNLQSTGAALASYSFRLPTEKEWMTFAQCGDNREYPWGNNWPPPNGKAGNYSDTSSAWKHKIGGYRDDHPVTCDVQKSWPNRWGLYGVGGNVWECCARDGSIDAFGAWRGESWLGDRQERLRCSFRYFISGSGRDSDHVSGFRLVLSR